MRSNVKTVSTVDGGYYSCKYISGNTVDMILERDGVQVKCEQIVICEHYEDGSVELDDIFDEWMDLANDGEDGYTIIK